MIRWLFSKAISLFVAQPKPKPPSRRSSQWPATRKKFLETHRECEACGYKKFVTPHHVLPYHLYPALELDHANLIALCEGPTNCHLMIGHLKDWKAYNPDVRAHASWLKQQIKNRKY